MIRRLIFLLCALAVSAEAYPAEPPRLVVLIVVDQLREDSLARFRDRFGPGGFRRLMDRGVHYTNAHYQHAATYTAVGHATLVTGRHTADHGLPGNRWLDRERGREVYSVQRAFGDEVRPGRLLPEDLGPDQLTFPTVGDDLIRVTAGSSRVFGVAIKDRGAIVLAGQRGKAFWFHEGRFVSNERHYYKSGPPAWVATWNGTEGTPADRYRLKTWALKYPRDTYAAFCDADLLDCAETEFPNRIFLGPDSMAQRTLPYTLRHAQDFYKAFRHSPFADRLTLEFAKELVLREKLGQRESPDFLAISFSAADYIGHAFGPESIEAEDHLLRLDEVLADLLAFLDERLGPDRTTVALAADHGVGAVALDRLVFPTVRHARDFVPRLNRLLGRRFGTRARLVRVFHVPNLYLDLDAIASVGLDRETVESAVAREVLRMPGVRFAVTRTEIASWGKQRPSHPILRMVLRSFHPGRSGDLVLIPEHSWYLQLSPDDAGCHGSPWPYNTHVPILFAGPGIEPGVVQRRVAPAWVAATLARALGIEEESNRAKDPYLPEDVGVSRP